MANHKTRIKKLEEQQAAEAQRLTWKQFTEIDAAGFAELLERDPHLAAAWTEFVKDIPQEAADEKP
jgi:lipid A disaccharide synthetase